MDPETNLVLLAEHPDNGQKHSIVFTLSGLKVSKTQTFYVWGLFP